MRICFKILLLFNIICVVLICVLLPDGLAGILSALIEGDDTHYASGYSEDIFKTIQRDMTEAEVFALLGEPLKRWPVREGTNDARVNMIWTNSPNSNSYRYRMIQFHNGKVIDKIAYYYWD